MVALFLKKHNLKPQIITINITICFNPCLQVSGDVEQLNKLPYLLLGGMFYHNIAQHSTAAMFICNSAHPKVGSEFRTKLGEMLPACLAGGPGPLTMQVSVSGDRLRWARSSRGPMNPWIQNPSYTGFLYYLEALTNCPLDS